MMTDGELADLWRRQFLTLDDAIFRHLIGRRDDASLALAATRHDLSQPLFQTDETLTEAAFWASETKVVMVDTGDGYVVETRHPDGTVEDEGL